MSFGYDLIIIGSTPAAIFAALTATSLKARVALIVQKGNIERNESILTSALAQTGSLAWAKEVISIVTEQNNLGNLAALGVDVINTAGEFCRLPQPGFVVKNKRLSSRAYIIATGSRQATPNLKINYLTFEDIWKKDDLTYLSDKLIIVGGSPQAIEIAQTLHKIGKDITLVVEENQILPQEEPEASLLIQAKLEAEGIKILQNSPITQATIIDGKKWVQAGDRAIETDEIIMATSRRKPLIEGLNLEGVGVEVGETGIKVNEKLQTTNPQIYALGDITGGYSLPNIAQYEAQIALKNALFLPLLKTDYRYLPIAILTEPQIARVGMTEAQAKRRYGEDVFVGQKYFKTISKAIMLEKTTGYCKIIVRGNGELLGACIVGTNAGELIGAIALAMSNKLKLKAIAELPFPSPSFGEIITQTALELQKNLLQNNKTLKDCLETLFIWRRNWKI
ncbi:MAG: NAD(P)/FAD-dependent oxidoreductase [Gomphosphaeria aponina SAG 52.96 = DSM 107014]|uniref:NAD(P)/FAD-dependent oxidoreductase n=1 Tax=Gomphosphaeria aponina SAG 52.96 = DSM 107014 TaxID=1521640 RepID=A0A941JM09_9CHRO|nr:NAD(P)/FAD-dependent oxidoreductase [Gomphosphaeria aponina SAG 52.96 = DSM 107014]